MNDSAPKELWQVVSLQDLSLRGLRVESDLDPDALPELPPTVWLQQGSEGTCDPEHFAVHVIVVFAMRAEPEDKPPLVLESKYQLTYSYPEWHPAPTKEEVAKFAERNGIFNAWPYWRELHQNLLSRMRIPLPPLPLFRPAGGIAPPVAEPPPPPKQLPADTASAQSRGKKRTKARVRSKAS